MVSVLLFWMHKSAGFSGFLLYANLAVVLFANLAFWSFVVLVFVRMVVWQRASPLLFYLIILGLGFIYIRDVLLGWCFAYIRHLVIVPSLVRCVVRRLDLIILAVSKKNSYYIIFFYVSLQFLRGMVLIIWSFVDR